MLGPVGVKRFAHVCVLPSRDFNTNVSDGEGSSSGSDEESDDTIGSTLVKISRLRRERRRVKRHANLRLADSPHENNPGTNGQKCRYAKFAFHVAGRKNKVPLLLRMAISRSIPIPKDMTCEKLWPFNARPKQQRAPSFVPESAAAGSTY